MKHIFLFLALILSVTAQAQDYCKQIKKEVTEGNTNFSYTTQYDHEKPPCARVERNFSTDPENSFDNFYLVLITECSFSDLLDKKDGGEAEREETKVVIEFDDKSKIVDDTIKLVHDYSAGDGSALRVAYFPITEDHLKELTAKKITKIYLAVSERTVPVDIALPLQQYIKCMSEVKK